MSHRVKPFLVDDKNLFILLSQYHFSWQLGDAGSQVISSYATDLIIPVTPKWQVRGAQASLPS